MLSGRTVGVVTAAALALLTAGLAGCVPEPEPTPTPTGFATEEEAFAAAEETYRAYVDALNQVDLSDPDTFEDVYAWTTGEANASARESFSQMHADGWVVSGVSAYDSFRPVRGEEGDPVTLSAELCLDVSLVTVTDSTGASTVSEDRLDRQPALVTFDHAASPTGLLISSSRAIAGDACAG